MANFLSFLRALPTLIALARELWRALKEMHEAHERRKRIEKLKNAIIEARVTKDTSKLERLFNENPDIDIKPEHIDRLQDK